MSGCGQLVVGPTHARGGTLDLLMTGVPDLVQASIGNSDHSSLSAIVSMAQAVSHLCLCRCLFHTCVFVCFFIKHEVNWNIVCGAIQDLLWRYIWSADNSVEVLNEPLSPLVGRYLPTKVIRGSMHSTRVSLDLMIIQVCFWP